MVLAIDRIGRTWQDTIRSICSLRDQGVKIHSLAEAEAQWARYLEAGECSPEACFGQILTMFAAWVADQELESIKRRTRDGLQRARHQGKALGPPRKIGPGQLAANAGRRREPSADRQRLRMLPQHGPEGAAAGGTSLRMPDILHPPDSPRGRRGAGRAPRLDCLRHQERAPVPVGGTAIGHPRQTSNDHSNARRALSAKPTGTIGAS